MLTFRPALDVAGTRKRQLDNGEREDKAQLPVMIPKCLQDLLAVLPSRRACSSMLAASGQQRSGNGCTQLYLIRKEATEGSKARRGLLANRSADSANSSSSSHCAQTPGMRMRSHDL